MSPRGRWQAVAPWCTAILLALTCASLAAGADAMPASSRRVATITGYHGYNAPLLHRVLQPRGVQIEPITGWLDPAQYRDFGVVIIDGSLKAANVVPCEFSPADLQQVHAYLKAGGTLVLMNQGAMTFSTEAGRQFLAQFLGAATPARHGEPRMRLEHPWVSHMAGDGATAWIIPNISRGLPASPGTAIIELRPGLSLLHHVKVGKGQIIYIGWDISRFRPITRVNTNAQQERAFNDQVRILQTIAAELYPTLPPRLSSRVFFDTPYELDAAKQSSPPPLPQPQAFLSHPPTRPLPMPSTRPLGNGPHYFVDPAKGDDDNPGSQAKPWKSVQHALTGLRPGDTLVLRGGVYFEHVILSRSGTPDKPLTIRSFPGELAVLDGSFREFQEQPAQAWEPVPDGAAGEFRSTRTYPQIAAQADNTNVSGRFADSMQPLHGYRFIEDLRSDNPYWTIPSNVGKESFVYCGPGVWFDAQSKRIHCRLAHTALVGLGQDNYRGQTDPRQLPLLVADERPTLSLIDARHVRLQDLVLRGSKGDTLRLSVAGDVVLDGLSIYGGRTCMLVDYTQSLRVIHCAFRGIAAPWSFRSHLKYRGIEAQIITAGKWEPADNCDFELAYCEFTDSIDGLFIGNVSDMRVHHNVIDNLSDDAVFVTAMATADGDMPSGRILVYQNRISRCLTTFAFGAGHGRQFVNERGTHTGQGVWICRNVIDLRQPVPVQVPKSAEAPQEFTDLGRCQGDHGSPIWEPLFIYHNTIVAAAPAWRNYYLHGWGGHANSTVRVLLNNLVAQIGGAPGVAMQDKPIALLFDGNLHYSLESGAAGGESFKTALQTSVQRTLGSLPHNLEAFPTPLRNPLAPPSKVNPAAQLLAQSSQDQGVPLRGQHDVYGDPQFAAFGAWPTPGNYRLTIDSAAGNAGVSIPSDWFDPLRALDVEAPDCGALPVGHDGWRVGIGGRYDGAACPQ